MAKTALHGSDAAAGSAFDMDLCCRDLRQGCQLSTAQMLPKYEKL